MAGPFLKWAGGKSKLAAEVLRRAPAAFTRYHEPFVGGGAIFFAMAAARPGLPARLADSNADLIACYTALRDDVDGLVAELEVLERRYLCVPDAERPSLYYEVRRCYPPTPAAAAARFIFLNRTGYNGLYRVNGRGQFNVPHGRYVRPAILREETLRAASATLQGVVLACEDFAAVGAAARPGDFVYFDPPYHPLSRTASFTAYTRQDFTFADQERLRDVFEDITGRGVAALLSNSQHPAVEALYSGRGFDLETVAMSRAINSNAAGRAPVAELLVSNLSRSEVLEAVQRPGRDAAG